MSGFPISLLLYLLHKSGKPLGDCQNHTVVGHCCEPHNLLSAIPDQSAYPTTTMNNHPLIEVVPIRLVLPQFAWIMLPGERGGGVARSWHDRTFGV